VDDRSLTRVLALTRKELDELGKVPLTDDDLNLLKWRLGIASNIRYATNASLAGALVWIQLADVPLDYVQKYPQLLEAVTVGDVTRMAAACRKTAVLLLAGDPGVVENALKATAR
jgi:predicted Zn-dependent peptidase